jgi:hypothetical protein
MYLIDGKTPYVSRREDIKGYTNATAASSLIVQGRIAERPAKQLVAGWMF